LKRAGALLLQDGTDTEAAIDALVDAHSVSPNDMECTLLLADAYTVAGNTALAQDLISRQIAIRAGRRSPELASLYHRLARVAHVGGDREGELSALTSGLEADAQNGFVASELASLALEVGDVDLATRALRSITLLKDPATSQIPRGLAYQYLGEIARQQGDPKRAMLLLKRAIEDDPSLDAARQLIEELRAEGA
jgi:tetratricopeptide (TPR) repeat protein